MVFFCKQSNIIQKYQKAFKHLKKIQKNPQKVFLKIALKKLKILLDKSRLNYGYKKFSQARS